MTPKLAEAPLASAAPAPSGTGAGWFGWQPAVIADLPQAHGCARAPEVQTRFVKVDVNGKAMDWHDQRLLDRSMGQTSLPRPLAPPLRSGGFPLSPHRRKWLE